MQIELPRDATPDTKLAAIADELPDTNVRDTLQALSKLPLKTSAAEAAAVSGTSGYAAHSVPLAIFVALVATDLPSAILAAVGCGGDTDTMASIVGHILGAQGYELPADWLARLPCAAEIDKLCRSLPRTP